MYLNGTARRLLAAVPRDDDSVVGFPQIPHGGLQTRGEATRPEHTRQHRRRAESGRSSTRSSGCARSRSASHCRQPDGQRWRSPFVISRILNHSEEKDITSVYDRYSYDAEKRAAVESWNRQLTAILKGRSVAGVRRFEM